MSSLTLVRVSPMTTIQDYGRSGLLAHGIAASGPMDRRSFADAQAITDSLCGAAIEIGPQGIDFTYSGGPIIAGLAGGQFTLEVNGTAQSWPTCLKLTDGTNVSIRTGADGNYGYLRFAAEIEVPVLLGSRATNATAGLGGFEGRVLRSGDRLSLQPLVESTEVPRRKAEDSTGPIRFIWGIHADLFPIPVRQAFVSGSFRISSRMDRMGVRLDDVTAVFVGTEILGLVSDAVVPGDIQILGDGTPIVLMRDHQPTGGYPRIGTVIDADLDRFAQIRPCRSVQFAPVTVDRAQVLAGWRR